MSKDAAETTVSSTPAGASGGSADAGGRGLLPRPLTVALSAAAALLVLLGFLALAQASGAWLGAAALLSVAMVGFGGRSVQSSLLARQQAQTALRESEGRLKAILDAAVDGILTMDERGTVETINGAASRIFGYAAEEVVGRNVKMLMPQPYCDAHDGYLARYLATGERRIIGIGREVEGLRKDGSRFPLELAVGETRLADGRRVFTGIVRDISERKRAEETLRARTAELETVMETVPMAVWLAHDPEGKRITGSRFAAEMLRLAPDGNHSLSGPDADRPSHFRLLKDGQELPPDRLPVQRAARGEVVRGEELRVVFEDGSYFDELVSATPVRDAAGAVAGAVGAAIDITARKAAEEHQRLLLAELSHRVKNTLALIQAMARQTASRADTVPQFVQVFAGRVQALAAAHDLLTATGWTGADLAALVRQSLRTHSPEQVTVRVTDLVVAAALAQDLAPTFHELATNAVKYGALSVPEGHVLVEGDMVPVAEGGQALRLVWRETGGPAVERPPARRGFGTLLVRQAVIHGRGGEVDMAWRREGLVCTIRVPLVEGSRERRETAAGRLLN